jgi:putative transposase
MSKVLKFRAKGKREKLERISQEGALRDEFCWPGGERIDSEKLLISLLLPPAIKEFFRRLEGEVETLCGNRYSRGGETDRWGKQAGSICLGKQQVAIERPRVRRGNKEVELETYKTFQDHELFDGQVFQEGLKRVTQRDYHKGLPAIAGAFGFTKSTVSRAWKRATKKQLEQLMGRDLKPLKLLAIFLDGKRFKQLGVIVALGVGENGKKHVLGLYQASSENGAACLALLNDLEKRGLPEAELLFVVDGGSGLNSALEKKYSASDPTKRSAVKVRCHYHKYRNIEDILGSEHSVMPEVKSLFWGMRNAENLTEAKTLAASLEKVLKPANISALRSFQEAKPDLLVLHELNLNTDLRRCFSTTNPIESLNSLLEEDLRRNKRWRDSEHFMRWIATAALTNEKRMHRVKGYRGLVGLKQALHRLCSHQALDGLKKAA